MQFELLEELGRGGTGIVFKARHRETDAIVALKRLNKDVEFAEREVLIARTVVHPNVCKVYDLFHEDGYAWISMEFIDGEALHDFLKRSGSPSIDQALRITREIMDGLEAAHLLGIVHRDLNPQNILIARDGTVKLTDFGLARVAGPQGHQDTRMDSAGTPGYVAPEQVRGFVDARADLYSLGFILYQMVYHLPKLPRWLDNAISGCIEKDREQRYASVAELRAALRPPLLGRRVASFTSILAVCLVVVLSVWIVSWKFPSGTIPVVQPAPAVAPPVAPDVPAKDPPTLAVLFEGPVGDAVGRAILRGGKFTMVERRALDKALSELKLKNKVGVDPATGQQVGKVLGAQYFMVGSSTMFLGEVHIGARLIETESTKVILGQEVSGDRKDTLKLAEELGAKFTPPNDLAASYKSR